MNNLYFTTTIPFNPSDHYFIEELIAEVPKRMKRQNTTRRPMKEDRNNQILRWHFFGFGYVRIQKLLTDEENAIEKTTIANVVGRFNRFMTLEERKEYDKRRRTNIMKLERKTKMINPLF